MDIDAHLYRAIGDTVLCLVAFELKSGMAILRPARVVSSLRGLILGIGVLF